MKKDVSAISENTASEALSWSRVERLFAQREIDVIAWITSNSLVQSETLLRRFTSQFGQYQHIELSLADKQEGSLYLLLRDLLEKGDYTRPLFHIRHLPHSKKLIAEINFERELLFRQLPASLVFWSDEYTMRLFQGLAPDFWDWLVYKFEFEQDVNDGLLHEGMFEDPPLPAPSLSSQIESLQKQLEALAPERARGRRYALDYAYVADMLGQSLFRAGRLIEARDTLLEVISICEKEDDKRGLANALVTLGKVESRLGNVERAQKVLEEAIGLFQKIQNDLGQANALVALGELENRLGNVERSRQLLDMAIGLYPKVRDDLGMANALKMLGDLESRLGNVERARQLLQEAIGRHQQVQDDLGRANALQALGNLESRLGNVQPARKLLDEAIDLYQKEQNGLGSANTYMAIGDLEMRTGNPVLARQHYERALAIYQDSQSPVGIAYTAADLLRCRAALGDTEDLQNLAELAIQAARQSHIPAIQQYVERMLSEAGLSTLQNPA